MITSLQNEDWQNANTLSSSLLNKISKEEQGDPAACMLRYMYIFSEAGLMNLNKVSQSDALKKVIGFTGQMVILPAHLISLKNAFNSIELVNDKTDSLFITATNIKATSIFSFEYIILDSKMSLDDFNNHVGQKCRLGGIIRSISVEGHIFPRFRLIIERGIAKIEK